MQAASALPLAPASQTPAGAADIAFPGGFARYATPNPITRWRVDTFFSKERDTLAWIESFDASDILVDVGANVGMYAIWAAKTRGVSVIAFEPESQNYGLLNLNIHLNGLSEKISAYCMAISERSGFDSFYLQRFEAGGSCHSFGAPIDPNLEAVTPAFRQGCFAAPLDELIAAGVIPAPTHVKIDVDGLEHAVIAGMTETLQNPSLKSVLVEINGRLDEHSEILTQMAQLGFHIDDRQREASLQKEGFFKGAGNIIFWKDADAAAALGLKLSGKGPATIASAGRKLAGLTAADAMEAVEAAIAAAPVHLDPTPYWYADQVFPPAFYEEMLSRMPAPSFFTPITDLGWVAAGDHTEANRSVLEFGGDGLKALPGELGDFWRALAAGFQTERFALVMLRKFLPQMAERFGETIGQMRFSTTSMLLNDAGKYALGPHTDRPKRVLASLFYLPTDANRPELGTSLYLPKAPGFACPGGPHHKFDRFLNVATMPYVPNSAFCFFKTDTSFHGVEPVPAWAPPRQLLSYILESAS